MAPEHAPVWRARLRTHLSSAAPRTHARNLEQLRAAHPDLSPDELARQLVADAARHCAAMGAAAACCALTPIPGSAPLAAAGESAMAAAVRVRLTAELSRVYGLPDPSPVNEGATGFFAQFAARDGHGVASALSALPAAGFALARSLPRRSRRRLLRKFGTMLTATAVTAALRCGRETRKYGEALRRDLRADPAARTTWPAG